MPYVGDGSKSQNKSSLDISLATNLCDNPSVAAQLCAVAMAAPLHGFYFQLGTNKAQTSYMFALKHSDPSNTIIFYAADWDTFRSEFVETLIIISERHKNMAVTLQGLFVALKGTLKDVWDAEHDKDVSNKPLTD